MKLNKSFELGSLPNIQQYEHKFFPNPISLIKFFASFLLRKTRCSLSLLAMRLGLAKLHRRRQAKSERHHAFERPSIFLAGGPQTP
jgi:hypothetical protein